MGLEAMIRLIERESAEEAARLVAEAEARARSIVEGAQASAAASVEAAVERAEPALRAEEVRAVNAARLRLLERRATLAAERVGAVFDAAAARLAALADGSGGERWRRAVGALARESLAGADPGARVLVRARDAPSVADAAASAGALVELLDGPDPPAGLVVRSGDGRLEVDATLPARLGRARVRLAESVARLMRLEAEGRVDG